MSIKTFQFTPAADDIGHRIDRALGLHPDIRTRSRAEHLIRQGLVTLNGKTIKNSHKIAPTEIFTVSMPPPEDPLTSNPEIELEILFDDPDLLIINKPAGLVVHPAAGHVNDTLVNALIGRSDFSMKFGESRPGIVHRLDKDTSGVLVVAKNDESQRLLIEQFKARKIHRRYQALIYSSSLAGSGTIMSYLGRHPTDRKRFASVRDSSKTIIRKFSPDQVAGKWAVTHFRTLSGGSSGLRKISLWLETGRTHQIRVHLSEMGSPILADPIYGKTATSLGSLTKRERDLVSSLPRLCLHAEELGFRHPKTGERLFFSVPWPADLVDFLEPLGLL